MNFMQIYDLDGKRNLSWIYFKGCVSLCLMSRKIYLVIAALAFLMSLISVYFGTSIYNAHENMHVQHLNEMDHLDYYDASEVPLLSRMAAFITLPFLVLIIGFELYVSLKTPSRIAKRIALVVIGIALTLIVLVILVLNRSLGLDFSHWGFAWVFGGLFTIAGNAVSIFLKRN